MNKKTLSLAMGCIPILFTQSVQAGGIKVDLQDTPTAVTAIGAAQLEKANIADLADLSIIKPNTSIGVAQFNIRGLGNANGAVDNAAGFASLYRVNGSTPVAMVENLPILVGPQGTLRTPVDLGTTANIDKLELVLLVSNQPHKSADWNSFALSASSFEADVGSTKLTFGGETVPDSGAISFSGEDSYASYFSDNEAYNYGYQESFAGSVNANLRAVQYRSDLKLSDFSADPFAASVYGLDASAGVVDFVDYAATNNFGDWLQSSHAGASGGSDITVSSGDNSFTSEGVGSTIDFDYLRNSLDTGASCTLRFSYDGFYQHANLNGIGRTFDQPWITYSLDADQSDDSQGTYEQGRYFSYLTDSDDNDQWELDGRDTEIDNAWCVSLKPRFDYKGTLVPDAGVTYEIDEVPIEKTATIDVSNHFSFGGAYALKVKMTFTDDSVTADSDEESYYPHSADYIGNGEYEGTGTTTFANFNNVSWEYKLKLDFGYLTGSYEAGLQAELPGGNPARVEFKSETDLPWQGKTLITPPVDLGIWANGYRGNYTMGKNDDLTLSVSANYEISEQADYFVAAEYLVNDSPYFVGSFDLQQNTFTEGLSPTLSTTTSDIPLTEFINIPSGSNLPEGTLNLYFGRDTTPNGSLDLDTFTYGKTSVFIGSGSGF